MAFGSESTSLLISRRVAEASSATARSYTRLSSGLRINSASDDAAGLSISTSLNVGARVFNQGIRNLNDGISAVNIATGTLTNLVGVVTRLKELAEQSANGVYGNSQRVVLDKKGISLTDEFNRLIASTSFNGLQLLDQSNARLRFQAGFGINGGIDTTFGAQLSRNVNSGSFGSAITVAAPAAGSSASDQLVDVNGDGKADILQLDSGGSLKLLLSNGDGTFSSSTLYSGVAGDQFKVGDS